MGAMNLVIYVGGFSLAPAIAIGKMDLGGEVVPSLDSQLPSVIVRKYYVPHENITCKVGWVLGGWKKEFSKLYLVMAIPITDTANFLSLCDVRHEGLG